MMSKFTNFLEAREQAWHEASSLEEELVLECLLCGRLPMRVSSLDQVISKAIYLYGVFEAPELAFIRGVVRPGATVVDAGANIGVHTLVMADCVGASGMVHAFEPSAAFRLLKENVQLNGFQSRTKLHNIGLAACRTFRASK